MRPDGAMVDDFEIVSMAGAVHVLNVPSPAATASLNIGRLVAERVESLDRRVAKATVGV